MQIALYFLCSINNKFGHDIDAEQCGPNLHDFFFFLTFISLLNYIKIFQCIETLLGVEYIYIYRSKEGKG